MKGCQSKTLQAHQLRIRADESCILGCLLWDLGCRSGGSIPSEVIDEGSSAYYSQKVIN